MSRKIRLKNIYLQNYFVDFGIYEEDCTWCEDKQNDNDIEYILQSEYDQLRSENKKLREALQWIANSAGEDACGYTTGEGHSDCIWKARKALNEVTK